MDDWLIAQEKSLYDLYRARATADDPPVPPPILKDLLATEVIRQAVPHRRSPALTPAGGS